MSQERARNRRHRILDAALAVFSSKGFASTAMDDIALASETSKGGVYFHFPGKQALFLALLDRTAEQLRSRIEAAGADAGGPLEQAEAALKAVVRVFSEHRALARLFMVEAFAAGPEFHTRMAEIRSDFVGLLKARLDAARSAGEIEAVDTEIAARAWFGAVYEVITHWALTRDPRPLSDVYAILRPLLRRSLRSS
jgi:AcrR family transcriptional regulator